MPISSVIIRTKDEPDDGFMRRMRALTGISELEACGRAVVAVLETGTTAESERLFETLQSWPGVVQVDLVFHHYERETEHSGAAPEAPLDGGKTS